MEHGEGVSHTYLITKRKTVSIKNAWCIYNIIYFNHYCSVSNLLCQQVRILSFLIMQEHEFKIVDAHNKQRQSQGHKST